jgi:two-component system CheB/CheR fusion protein
MPSALTPTPSIDNAPSSAASLTPIPVVGVGASAGGLDAFTRLIHHLPSNTGMAYVLVQHLDPEHESLLPELLGRAGAIPVVQAVDGVRIEADRAYVIAPNTTMTVTDGHLRLIARKRGRGLHLPIDAFLCSLAEVHGSGAVGVILSGAGSDGARGIQAIKEVGGITIAQDTGSARFASMPRSAVDTGAVDFVLTPEEIAGQLSRLGSHLVEHPADPPAAATAPPLAREDEDLRKILTLLHTRTGVDFQHYRRGTLHRRIVRRMLVHRLDTRGEYLAHLLRDPPELDLLYEDLLIGVTRFFRDPEVFARLQETAFPEMMRGHAPDTPVRMWVAGCAAGEEAYSLAIALLEFLGNAVPDVQIQIFGTDLSEPSIAKARIGLYPEGIADHVSPERLRRFFTREEGGYRITKTVRDLCVFSRQNVVRDPPFSHLDFISCRNVLIYLGPVLQRRVFPIFHYALETNGFLVLGTGESVGSATELFEPLAKVPGIYRRRVLTGRPVRVAFATPTSIPAIGAAPHHPRPRALVVPPSPEEIEGEADRHVLAQFTPPGVVINDYMEILQFRGDTAGFLAHLPGVASLDLVKLARPELVMPLHAAIRGARSAGRAVREDGVRLVDGDAVRQIAIDVLPFRLPSTNAQFYVVSFIGTSPSADVATVPATGVSGDSATRTGRRRRAPVDGIAHDALVDELATTKRYLQGIVEQHESTTEELRAASEEIQSSNEELQSTNEELETTKEEVQSSNEELTTVNEELRHRNQDLSALSSDLANVLTSTTIPILIVSTDLRLRRFTPATARVMHVVATDVGRPLSEITRRVTVPDLERLITRTIETRMVTEHEVQDDDGHWWALTLRPYQAVGHGLDGAVLVFADIDASKRYGERATEVSEVRRQLLDAAESGRAIADAARLVAEIANKTKGNFLASMSHDLRTPLNAITGYTELIDQGLRGPVTEPQRVDLARIKRSARYLLALINDILNFARVEAGHVDVRLNDVAVGPLVRELEELIRPQLAIKSLTFDCADTDAIVSADPEKVQQILLNLLSNALQFTTPDGRIGIDYALTDDTVRITVSDTGIGIAPDQIEHIFEPFVQIDRGLTSPASGGVGLGLAISRDLARAMKGDLDVESTRGEGSRFVLTLRRVR